MEESCPERWHRRQRERKEKTIPGERDLAIVKAVKKFQCDDMVCVEWREITLICPYFVPPTSPFQKRNEKRMIELQQRVLESKGNVIIMTDANGWIGELPSLVAKKEDGYER